MAAAERTGEADGGERAVKIACRNVWKVYGPKAESYFPDGDGRSDDPDALVARLREDGLIPAAADVSFDVRAGEIFVIMGLSGSGKSTIVRCLSRLVEPTAGEILLDGENLLRMDAKALTDLRRHKMGMVFQNFGLLPHLTVLENVAFPLKVQGVGEEERRAKALEMIELVGLDGRDQAFPRQLSGGQQQRVGIARSLCVDPELWFLDEPFSALDPLIRRQMQDEFVRLQTMLHKTIVFITHDFLEALKIADRIAIMKDGRVVQIGRPSEIVLNPATDYVREFTEDVPMVRVITVADVMERGEAAADGAPEVTPEMTLEAILPHFADADSPLTVLDRTGAAVGRVTPKRVLRALAEHGEAPARGDEREPA
ncbi:MAG: betaine/proline/choline family ABC transporter ATP-binding protein [Marivibrio sp.]|uniref:quaternary amine ABC transporter ATP-binding protein n=1 Tax=Marivibrio sp. TaxID=2039719 RepID=UPI0032ECC48F